MKSIKIIGALSLLVAIAAQGASSSSFTSSSSSSSSSPTLSAPACDPAATAELWRLLKILKNNFRVEEEKQEAHREIVDLLTSKTVDVNSPNPNPDPSWLHTADEYPLDYTWGYPDLTHLLITHGADASRPKTIMIVSGHCNALPTLPFIHRVAVCAHSIPSSAYNLMNALLSDNPNRDRIINLKSQYDTTPLYEAIKSHNESRVNTKFNTIPSIAQAYVEKIKALLDNGADIDSNSLTIAYGEVLALLHTEQQRRTIIKDAITAGTREPGLTEPLSKIIFSYSR